MSSEEISLAAIQDAVVRAKQRLGESTEVDPQHRTEVIAALAAINFLVGAGSKPVGILPQTFAEWADIHTLKSHPDKFLAVAVYLFETQGQQSVSKATIQECYKKARWLEPRNYADVFIGLVEKRHLAKDEGQAQWTLTSTGHKYFQTLKQDT